MKYCNFAREAFRFCGRKIAGENIGSLDCSCKTINILMLFNFPGGQLSAGLD